MTRKFLFCFPLRLGNIVFGYIVIIISLAVAAVHLYQLGLSLVSKDEDCERRFGNFEKLETIFGTQKEDLVTLIVIIYYLTYVIIGLLMFIFSAIFTCGAYKVNDCAITTFFMYSFVHIFFSIVLIVWEALTAGWIQLGLIVVSDVFLLVCLFSVKYLMEAIRSGNIYHRPGEVLDKY
ncbi:uncharacterized protein LOC123873102 [Maniola jurtina]|uniref:uncharacterized protein LOC123873102 n=1 Tax=Maniola jurtina TaxID=191418 RepID=UPI001E689AB0|nr:uncharacterized protein LOC123873102 [Maniola jurtina]XP_045773770.1 uncharacterized protein LOC123873102 [Maniola jurtina]XP_045773771.1 uncharacterized protein LOC123873102 [Maniola jurtina]